MTPAKLLGIAVFIWVIISFKNGRLKFFGVAELSKIENSQAYWVVLAGLAVVAGFLSFWQ